MSSNMIEEAIVEAFGERCPKVQPGCPCCDVWAQYDALVALQERVEEVEKALRPFAVVSPALAGAMVAAMSRRATSACGEASRAEADEDRDAVAKMADAFPLAHAYFTARTKAGVPHEQE